MPNGLYLINSNHMEVLAGALADLLGTPAAEGRDGVFEPDIVLVQSKGMQRWLSMAVAEANGICANVHFPFPNTFVEQLCAVVGDASEITAAYKKEALAFRIFDLLPGLLDQPVFEPLKGYLSNGDRPLKRFQLCRKLADTLDQYAVFRPDWLFAWEEGRQAGRKLTENQKWQAGLWRVLRSEDKGIHRSTLQKHLVEALSDPTKQLHGLPARVSVFGISHLPPFHLQVLEALSQRIPVYLFLLNPCRHYWSDIVSDQEMIRIRNREKGFMDNEALYLERGNRLLATLGALGKQFFDAILQSQTDQREVFGENRQDRLLGRIQQDILDLVDRPAPGGAERSVLSADGSLRIHSCHSPMREIEVLHDQLLDMLDTLPGLQPREILVMAPHIGTYAPFIHAVFGNSGDSPSQIPYTVADQSVLSESTTIEAFMQLLDIIGGRLEASKVLNLLACRSVHTKFDLGEADLAMILRWVRGTGIRWGWDGVHREDQGLPGFSENSWQAGLDRLFLGMSMESGNPRLFNGVLPFDAITAGEGESLGQFSKFVGALHESGEIADASDTLNGWSERLLNLFERFFLVDPQSEPEIHPLRSTLEQITHIGDRLGNRVPLPFEVIRYYLKDTLGQSTRESGFMAGGVTFCAMLPMRSIPFRVICLLGMNHDAFPRENREPGFNLIAADPRPGDRSKRNDDRYLFLETLISARHTLYLSYVGQSIQDNAPIPPSVVVDELIEYVGEGFGVKPDKIVVRHPLHAFSGDYFSGEIPHLFSYNKANCTAAAAMSSPCRIEQLFSEPLPIADEQFRQSDWAGLIAFWTHPIQYLMQRRLGIYIKTRGDAVENRESFKLDALERYQLNQLLLKSLSDGASKREAYRIARAANMLPHGTPGRVQCDQQTEQVSQFLQTLSGILPEERACSIRVEKVLSPFSLDGEIDRVYPQGRIVYRMGKARGKDLLTFFITHLALHFCDDHVVARESTMVCEDKIWQLGPLDQAEDILHLLLKFYWQGLHLPLSFFCRSSFSYAHEMVIKERSAHEARSYAERTWHGNRYAPGEADDPYHRLCFRGKSALPDDFEETAMQVFGPLLSLARSY